MFYVETLSLKVEVYLLFQNVSLNMFGSNFYFAHYTDLSKEL